jgi:hypothetical protein
MRHGKLGVFLSWSGDRSRAIAEILDQWLPKVLQQKVQPYFTPDDIAKGAQWPSEITAALEECEVGIICLTRENLREPWINFEAGALLKRMGGSRVCPILFNVSHAELEMPLASFQTTAFDQKDMKRMLNMINEELRDQALSQEVLDDEFNLRWPSLKKQVAAELRRKTKAPSPLRSQQEVLEQILELGRVAVRLEKEFTGRLSSNVGYLLGEMSTTPDSLEPIDRDRLVDAIDHCRRGYVALKEVGGPPEFMALNNLVYYSTALGDAANAASLLDQARILIKAGEQHYSRSGEPQNATNLILTGCRAILQLSADDEEKRQALRRVLALLEGPLFERQRKEAQLYVKEFAGSAQTPAKATTKAKTVRPQKRAPARVRRSRRPKK